MTTCAWALSSELERQYHDTEWGIPSKDDAYLFEMLILEGMQAGLSWRVVLQRRENMRLLLNDFDYHAIAEYTDETLNALTQDAKMIRHRLKIYALRTNAIAFKNIQDEYGTFAHYLWSFVHHRPICNHFKHMSDVPANSQLSDRISKDLKRRGFKFVGSTTIYAYLQAVGVINDHLEACPCKYINNKEMK